MGMEYKKYEIQLKEKTDIEKYLDNKNSNYISLLEIPKINFKRGITNESNINKNISFLKDSNMPNISGSTTIIAGHSGNSSNSYFKNLYKLKIGDYAYLFYDRIKYKYIVYKMEVIKKTGKLKLNNDRIKKLILITCKDDDKQIIVYFKFTKKETI